MRDDKLQEDHYVHSTEQWTEDDWAIYKEDPYKHKNLDNSFHSINHFDQHQLLIHIMYI